MGKDVDEKTFKRLQANYDNYQKLIEKWERKMQKIVEEFSTDMLRWFTEATENAKLE